MNEVMNSVNNVIMDNFHKTDNILNDVQTIIEVSQKEAYRSVNTILSQRNWLIGYRIAVEELAGEERAEYGVEIIKNLSRYLTQKYGKGYDRSNLYHCLRFYKAFHRLSTQRVDNLILDSHGHIIVLFFKCMMKQLANGMRKKPMSRHGVFVLYREILIPNIIIVCFNHRIKKL